MLFRSIRFSILAVVLTLTAHADTLSSSEIEESTESLQKMTSAMAEIDLEGLQKVATEKLLKKYSTMQDLAPLNHKLAGKDILIGKPNATSDYFVHREGIFRFLVAEILIKEKSQIQYTHFANAAIVCRYNRGPHTIFTWISGEKVLPNVKKCWVSDLNLN